MQRQYTQADKDTHLLIPARASYKISNSADAPNHKLRQLDNGVRLDDARVSSGGLWRTSAKMVESSAATPHS